MKVICLSTSIGARQEAGRGGGRDSSSPSMTFDELDEGATYEVLALEFERQEGWRVFVHSIEGRPFPSPYPLGLFSIADASVPPGWEAAFGTGADGAFLRRLSFATWARDDHFFERLIDFDPDALDAYDEARRALD